MECFADADWAGNIDDRKSTGGHCLYLGGNLVSWSSKKQGVVARSSTEAEYRSLASAATDILWFQSLFKELGIALIGTPILWCDNLSAKQLAHNPVFHSRTKHLEIDLHFLRDLVAAQKLDIRFVSTEFQTADIFTKPLSISRFQRLSSKLITDKDQCRLRGSNGDSSEVDDQYSRTKFKQADLLQHCLRGSVKDGHKS